MKKRTTVLSTYCVLLLMGATTVSLFAQTSIGGINAHPSAMLDVQSDSKGVLFPRMNTMKRDQIQSPASGLMIYNTQTTCLEINLGTPVTPFWKQIKCGGTISALNCNLGTLTGVLTVNSPATGVSVTVPYTNGNGEAYQGQPVSSTGVEGLTATLASGSFASGDGNLTYSITGTPTSAGTASFELSIGGQSCTLEVDVLNPNIDILDCTNAIRKGEMLPNFPADGVTVILPYSNGDGSAHSGQMVNSTGVEGYTATLAPGNFASGDGTLTYAITGLGTEAGIASFLIQIGGQSCNLDLSVMSCFAKVNATDTIIFHCYNLGAYNTRVDPFTPSWEIIGNYFSWGRNPTCFGIDGVDATNPCTSPIYGAAGPWGPTAAQDNAGSITGWSNTNAANTAWSDAPAAKGPEDPCPQGFRVPSKVQWDGVIANGTLTDIGSFTNSSTNYSSGKRIGSGLFLPTGGARSNSTGSLSNRGAGGLYWSSTGFDATTSMRLVFVSGSATTNSFSKASGNSLRCVAE
jgi:uncharacterized protein (TIGR02145 family)